MMMKSAGGAAFTVTAARAHARRKSCMFLLVEKRGSCAVVLCDLRIRVHAVNEQNILKISAWSQAHCVDKSSALRPKVQLDH